MNGNPYSALPAEGPYEVRIGSALITMVEPHRGHEHAYNRWYEDDHFYSGAMAMPWMFAGRRWVAPRALQQLRYPEDSGIAQGRRARAVSAHSAEQSDVRLARGRSSKVQSRHAWNGRYHPSPRQTP